MVENVDTVCTDSHFRAGYNNSGDEELAHWTDMRESKGEQVCRWHVLLEA